MQRDLLLGVHHAVVHVGDLRGDHSVVHDGHLRGDDSVHHGGHLGELMAVAPREMSCAAFGAE